MDRAAEPGNLDERELLLGWLAFHRDALCAKCDGLAPEQLVSQSAPPSNLTLLGLVRHMTEMERVYLVRALSGEPLTLVYCTDDDPEADFEGLVPEMATASIERWYSERRAADRLLATVDALDAKSPGNGYSVRWNLLKTTQEYARHNGHADIVRERIDGATGE